MYVHIQSNQCNGVTVRLKELRRGQIMSDQLECLLAMSGHSRSRGRRLVPLLLPQPPMSCCIAVAVTECVEIGKAYASDNAAFDCRGL